MVITIVIGVRSLIAYRVNSEYGLAGPQEQMGAVFLFD